MKAHLFPSVGLLALMLSACAEPPSIATPSDASNSLSHQHTNFNQGWKFNLVDKDAFSQTHYNDSQWQSVQLPHDWSIAHPFDENLNGATGYLPGGIGWYRKQFKTPESLDNHIYYINFDGIYNHSTIYLNGQKIGGEVNGYTPININLNPYLNPKGQDNTFAVRVDHSRYIDSRWYTGSGIYRDVTLSQFDKLHIPAWGNYVTTPTVSTKQATVNSKLKINNAHANAKTAKVVTKIINAQGEQVANQTSTRTFSAHTEQQITHDLTVSNPKLWSPETPNLYQIKTQIVVADKVVSSHSQTLGFRNLEFNPEKGFFLNGKHTLIKGVNLHHDAGLVGTAVPDDVWRRRLTTLKAAGVNAIRTAHNPASSAFLDLCDEMGFLVQAEIFDEWDNPKDKRLNQEERHNDYVSRGYADYFQTHAERDLKTAMLRDRNHPSIIMWSIGNEIEWTYPRYKKATGYFDMDASGNYFYNPPFISPEEIEQRFTQSKAEQYVLANTAKKLSNWVKQMDTTRPVTANLILPSVSHISGYTDALDIIGYSYRRVIYDYGHKLYPGKMLMGHENVPQWHEWKAVIERPFIAGTYLWTGIDYLGEQNKQWPSKAVRSGLLDTAGFPRASYHMFKTLWNDEDHLHLTTQTLEKSPYKLTGNTNQLTEKEKDAWQTRVWYWHDVNHHWNYPNNDKMLAVEAYTNCQSAELFLNGESMGVQTLANNPDHILKWAVPNQKGKLTAKGLDNCKATDSIKTATAPSQLHIKADRKTLKLQQNEVSHIEIQLQDKQGNPVSHQDIMLNVDVSGDVKLLGTDSGHTPQVKQYQTSQIKTYQGRALAIISGLKSGTGKVTISSKDSSEITSKTLTFSVN